MELNIKISRWGYRYMYDCQSDNSQQEKNEAEVDNKRLPYDL